MAVGTFPSKPASAPSLPLLEGLKALPASLWVLAFCGFVCGAAYMIDKSQRATRIDSSAAAAATTAGPADGGKKGPRLPSGSTLVVFGVLGLAGLASMSLAKKRRERLGRAGLPERPMQVISTLRMGPKSQMALVEVPGALLVVGSSQGGMSLLTELPHPEPMPEQARPAPTHQPLREVPGPSAYRRVAAASAAPEAADYESIAAALERVDRVSREHEPAARPNVEAATRRGPGSSEAEAIEARLQRLRQRLGRYA